jgi:hypothetical protein
MVGFLRRRKRSQFEDLEENWNGIYVDPKDFGDDYRDFVCPYCGHEWRNYGNGGLVFGMWPNCPKCHTRRRSLIRTKKGRRQDMVLFLDRLLAALRAPLPPDEAGVLRPEFELPERWPPIEGDRRI